MATVKKAVKEDPKSMNVKLSFAGYRTIKKYAQSKDLKIGAFIETTVLEKISKDKTFKAE